MIVYGVNSGVSITDLFIAGLFPGILVGLFLMIPAVYISRKKDMRGCPGKGERAGF